MRFEKRREEKLKIGRQGLKYKMISCMLGFSLEPDGEGPPAGRCGKSRRKATIYETKVGYPFPASQQPNIARSGSLT
jgi:hypothetical protein